MSLLQLLQTKVTGDMNKRTEAMLSNFSDREIRYILQYALAHLDKSYAPDDGTLQGSIVKRVQTIIIESRK